MVEGINYKGALGGLFKCFEGGLNVKTQNYEVSININLGEEKRKEAPTYIIQNNYYNIKERDLMKPIYFK